MSDDGLVQIDRSELDELRASLRQAEVDAAYWRGRAEALEGARERRGGSIDQLLPLLAEAAKRKAQTGKHEGP